jgi:hypothetical protein
MNVGDNFHQTRRKLYNEGENEQYQIFGLECGDTQVGCECKDGGVRGRSGKPLE